LEEALRSPTSALSVPLISSLDVVPLLSSGGSASTDVCVRGDIVDRDILVRLIFLASGNGQKGSAGNEQLR
jgi:hypothetical protein